MEHFYRTLEGYFTFPDFYRFLAEQMPLNRPSRGVEVGAFKGQSAAFLAVELLNRGAPCTLDLVDLFHDGGPGPVEASLAPVRSVLGTIHQGDSTEMAARYADASLDFVFIDASHVYEAVQRDIAAWRSKVRPGGILAGHDFCNWPGPETGAELEWWMKFGVIQAVTEAFEYFNIWRGRNDGGDARMLGHYWPVWWILQPEPRTVPTKISVVIPCYKQAHFLPDAVLSARAQTYPAHEIVVSAGDDESERVARELQCKVVRDGAKGLAHARNVAIEACTGELILPLDADDKIEPSFLAKTLAVIQQMGELAVVATSLREFGAGDGVFEPTPDGLRQGYIPCGCLFTKKMWQIVGGYDVASPIEDWAFWLDGLARGAEIRHVPELLFRYRKHPAQSTQHDPYHAFIATDKTLRPNFFRKSEADEAHVRSSVIQDWVTKRLVHFPDNARLLSLRRTNVAVAVSVPKVQDPSEIYTKAWMEEAFERYQTEYEYLADTIRQAWLIGPNLGSRVLDVGCGPALILQHLAKCGYDVLGVDGSVHARAAARAFIRDRILTVNLVTENLQVEPRDLVICTEVAEHLDAAHADRLVEVLCRAAKDRIYFTAAPPGQGGHDHVNEQPPAYWLKKFAQYGFRLDLEETQAFVEKLRPGIRGMHWFLTSSMLLRRVAPSGTTESYDALTRRRAEHGFPAADPRCGSQGPDHRCEKQVGHAGMHGIERQPGEFVEWPSFFDVVLDGPNRKLCLCMIVKDETEVIARCLRSVKPLLKHWVVVDTGSTDGTQAIVRRELAGIPGELFERPWRDFASNRNEALDLARDTPATHVLVIDADDELEIAPDFQLPNLTFDVFAVKVVHGEIDHWRPHLLRATGTVRYKGVLHEYLDVTAHTTSARVEGLTMRIRGGGARSRLSGGFKFQGDAEILRQALAKEPGNHRYAFYLAQSWRDSYRCTSSLDDLERAKLAYAHRAEMGGIEEEVYHALFEVARATETLRTAEPEEVTAAYLKAYAFRPSRAEPLFYLARYLRMSRGDFALAATYARTASALPPPSDVLFVERDIYQWWALDEFAVAASRVPALRAEAKIANEKLLTCAPEREQPRIRNNLTHCQ